MGDWKNRDGKLNRLQTQKKDLYNHVISSSQTNNLTASNLEQDAKSKEERIKGAQLVNKHLVLSAAQQDI